MPTQKDGREWPNTAKARPATSHAVPRFDRREDPEGNTDHQGKEECGAGQLQRRRQPLEHDVEHGTVLMDRYAEVAAGQLADEDPVLIVERPIQAQLPPQGVVGLLRQVLVGVQHAWIALQARQNEHHEGHEEDCDQRGDQPFPQKGDHFRLPLRSLAGPVAKVRGKSDAPDDGARSGRSKTIAADGLLMIEARLTASAASARARNP